VCALFLYQRAGGNAGLKLPIRTFPVSLVLVGSRTGGNAGLKLPIRTRPLSEMTVGLFFALTTSFDLTIARSYT
jgi:hypothetical protein